jgi:hypothetical protein
VLTKIAVRPAVEAALLHRGQIIGDEVGPEFVPLVDDGPQRTTLRLEAQTIGIAQSTGKDAKAPSGAIDLEDVGAVLLGLDAILRDVAVRADADIQQ